MAVDSEMLGSTFLIHLTGNPGLPQVDSQQKTTGATQSIAKFSVNCGYCAEDKESRISGPEGTSSSVLIVLFSTVTSFCRPAL
jgi:hypothetical protein